MKKDYPLINILCYKLPKEISNQLFNEYNNRFKEATYLIKNFDFYSKLSRDMPTIEILLALSIFHKRVICNLESANKFYGTVIHKSTATVIQIGSYKFNEEENKKLWFLLKDYYSIIKKFSLKTTLFDYYETKEFLRNVRTLKQDLTTNKKRRSG